MKIDKTSEKEAGDSMPEIDAACNGSCHTRGYDQHGAGERPKILQLNTVEKFFADLVWNG
ncbi:MAG: hypothetical protein FD130_1612 [Halothiobacillaceae bacterium]|nr:MAG: hypothetical protein FD130_1612 [Halothiobacillaceae bacterium]